MRTFYVRSGNYQTFLLANTPKDAVLAVLDKIEDEMMDEGICSALDEFIHCSEETYDCEFDPDAYHYLTINMLYLAGFAYLAGSLITNTEEKNNKKNKEKNI
jgi:hypothetical protein